MDCPVCKWNGNSKGYSQHVKTERHITNCALSRANKQIKQLETDLNFMTTKLKYSEEKNIFYEQLLMRGAIPLPTMEKSVEPEKFPENSNQSATSTNNDEETILKLLDVLTPDNWEVVCEELKTDSGEIMKFKDVFRSDYNFEHYKDTTWAVRFNEKKIIYGRVAPIGNEPALPDDELLKHKWYMTKSTRDKYEKYINRHSEYEQILEIAESIHKSNWVELILPVESDGKKLKKCKELYKKDFETYGYTTLQPVVYSDKTIKFIRPTKGCGYDGSETIFY